MAINVAAVEPAGPAPITITSKCCAVVLIDISEYLVMKLNPEPANAVRRLLKSGFSWCRHLDFQVETAERCKSLPLKEQSQLRAHLIETPIVGTRAVLFQFLLHPLH